MGRRSSKTNNAENYGGFITSQEMEFQAIVNKAREEVTSGMAMSSTRRSSRRLQTQDQKQSSPPKSTKNSDLQDGVTIGAQNHANVVDIADFKTPSNRERDAEIEREECWWLPHERQRILCKDFDDYVTVCRRHMGVGVDLAMRSLYRHKYNLARALERVEEDFEEFQITSFTKAEDDALVGGLERFGKNFAKISKKAVTSRSVGECVSRYYDLKKKICFNTNTICPTLMRVSTDDTRILKRSECANCRVNLYESEQKCDYRGRQIFCPPCDIYAKMTKRYRPSTVRFEPIALEPVEKYENSFYFDLNLYLFKLDKVEKEEEELQLKEIANCPKGFWPNIVESKHSSLIETVPHDNCFFVENDENKRWEMELQPGTYNKEMVVDGFLMFGKDFAKIADYAGLKHEGIAQHFYDVYADDYRLDFLIAHFNGREEAKNRVPSQKKKAMGRTRAATATMTKKSED